MMVLGIKFGMKQIESYVTLYDCVFAKTHL